MLNLSKNSIAGRFDTSKYKSFGSVVSARLNRVLAKILGSLLAVAILLMFLPWTQNIRARGYVTTLKPDQRPQTIHSIIAGRIEKWYVQEGDFVEKGDTILFISEVKDDYLDPKLLDRTNQQIDAKELTQKSYNEKVNALRGQIAALEVMQGLKREQALNSIKQAELQITADSIAYVVAKRKYEIQE